MATITPPRVPLLVPESSRRKSYPVTSELRYFDEPGGHYNGPRYTYEDGILRRYEGSRSVPSSPSKVIIDDSLMMTPATVTGVTSVAKPASYYLAHDDYEAARLDAADGIIDGAHFGTPIYKSGSSSSRSVISRPSSYYLTHDPVQATHLDAADGVLDGKYFGTPIYNRGPCADVCVDAVVTHEVLPVTCSVACPTPCSPQYPAAPSVVTSACTVQQYNPFADQFLDLRARLERDRIEFEQERARGLQDLAMREARLQLEKERIEFERERLRDEMRRMRESSQASPPTSRPTPIPTPMPTPIQNTSTKTVIKVKTREEAQRLDMQDGIIDGKYRGTPIEIIGQGLLVPPPHLMGKRVTPKPKGPPSASSMSTPTRTPQGQKTGPIRR